MEVRVNGQVAVVGVGGGWSLVQVVGAVRAWAEKAGSTICGLALDGREVTPQELARRDREGVKEETLLEVRTLDRTGVRTHALRRVSGLLPALRLDLSLAARSLGSGEDRGGLEALYRVVSTLGCLETTAGPLLSGPGDVPGPGADLTSALVRLQGLLREILAGIRAGDLPAVAARLDEEGSGLVDEWDRLLTLLASPPSAPE